MVFGFGGNNGDHHHRSSYGATPSTLEGDQQQRLIGKEEEDGDLKLSVVKRTRAFFSGRKSNHILGAIGTGLAVVGCASAYYSSFSPSSSPFSLSSLRSSSSSSSSASSLLLQKGGMLGSSSFLEQAMDVKLGVGYNHDIEVFNGGRLPPDEAIDAKPNLVYIKVPKTGSTTMANIVRRSSVRHGIKNVADSDINTWINEEPGAWWSHSEYSEIKSKIDALQHPYFSFSLLRDPVTRAISHFQFFVMFCKCKCDNGWEGCPAENDFPTTRDGIEDLLMRYLQRGTTNFRNSYQLLYTTTTGGEDVSFETAVNNDMIDLRFVGVLERFTESLVVLKEMLGLSLADVLYIPAKSAEYDWGDAAEISDGTLAKVKALFNGAEDYKYIDAASKKLDMLKADIPDYENKLNELEQHLSQAFDACSAHDIYTDEQQSCLDMYTAETLASNGGFMMDLDGVEKYAPLSEESRRKIFPAGAFSKSTGSFELD